ncbi:MAG: aldehyde ferredoxin oxidoreductase N-terminal domain-containing protein, partial [Planctomycetota bacterium]
MIAFALGGARTSGPGPALAVAAGPAVSRGTPTAARVSLYGRAPGFDGVTEAQVGGAFAYSFAASLDLLLVSGLEPGARRSIVVGAEGVPRAVDAPFDARAEVPARAAACGASALVVGPGADAGLACANVASTAVDSAAPSFVGRGGLGHAFARAGVAAVVAEAAAPELAGATGALRAALGRSPRLRTRAAGGTLELGLVRGAVDARRALDDPRRTRHGCRGCPTPCGWALDGDGSRPVGLRFSALRGALDAFEDPVAFVERCNALGVDAGAAAAHVARSSGASEPAAALERMLAEGSSGAPARAFALDRAHGADLAARVALVRGARGPEPLRALSLFGLGPTGVGEAGLAELVAPLPWTGGADPDADAGTLARWHECFAAAVDLTGFCAFSAGALVADGVLSVDELAEVVAPVLAGPRGWGAAAAVESDEVRSGS